MFKETTRAGQEKHHIQVVQEGSQERHFECLSPVKAEILRK